MALRTLQDLKLIPNSFSTILSAFTEDIIHSGNQQALTMAMRQSRDDAKMHEVKQRMGACPFNQSPPVQFFLR